MGAHYTDRDKIMMIVRPVVIEPLEAEWAVALAKMAALIDSAPKRTKAVADPGRETASRQTDERSRNYPSGIHQAACAFPRP
ncbi:hypothetical protein [Sphingopyxis sp.]|uniref:hypothetical protein n=1 Tax=Sphingopyxis sp. TaxID=1908224 RepID=UPI0025ED72CB|nr:hypothetical protein [Sphingopyxis sp.]MBK6415052.1 hypothetical protein [Sphingopyxis sp.]